MKLEGLFPAGRPLLVLAPMQDVTDLPFWKIMHRYGGPDLYYTEYFRVYGDSVPEKYILRSIRENPTGRPVIAQMIGQDLPALERTARALQKENVAGIDLNLGCPAPIVCRKSAGGGLLRHHDKIEAILQLLRETVSTAFTVKTRIGFESEGEFDALLELFARHPIDLLTVHGRTVKEMYRSEVHYDRIAQAVRGMACPVVANGNVLSAENARETAAATGAKGLMIGRGAIRNPWIFTQIRELFATGEVTTRPSLRDLRAYVELLYRETCPDGLSERHQVAKMKKYMNFIVQGVDEDGQFGHDIRRAESEREFFRICDRFLDREGFFEAGGAGPALVHPGSPRDCH